MTANFFRAAAAAASVLAMIVAAAPSAMSADYAPPPAPEVMDWTGLYVGGVFGVGCIESFYVPSWGEDPELSGCNFMGGVVGGFNYQMGSFVLGAEGDYMWGGETASAILDDSTYDFDGFATARGRIGYLATDSTLIFATAGAAWLNGTLFNGDLDANQTHFGYVVGGGIEHAFTNNFHLRVEYLYAGLDEQHYKLSCYCTADLDLEEVHMMRAGFTYNFSGFFGFGAGGGTY